jgi:hypothetical protein
MEGSRHTVRICTASTLVLPAAIELMMTKSKKLGASPRRACS